MQENISLKPSWLEVEDSIKKEFFWLKNTVFPYHADKNILGLRDDFFYRLIAILIVSGKIRVTEYSVDVNKMFGLVEYSDNSQKKHGGIWHDFIIKRISKYFNNLNYLVDAEPPLFYGQADVLINKEDYKPIYIEVDTISIFKLWINLVSMDNIIILNIKPTKIIKFDL